MYNIYVYIYDIYLHGICMYFTFQVRALRRRSRQRDCFLRKNHGEVTPLHHQVRIKEMSLGHEGAGGPWTVVGKLENGISGGFTVACSIL